MLIKKFDDHEMIIIYNNNQKKNSDCDYNNNAMK